MSFLLQATVYIFGSLGLLLILKIIFKCVEEKLIEMQQSRPHDLFCVF